MLYVTNPVFSSTIGEFRPFDPTLAFFKTSPIVPPKNNWPSSCGDFRNYGQWRSPERCDIVVAKFLGRGVNIVLFRIFSAWQVVLGDGQEISERDAKQSHLLTSTTEDEVSPPQSGANHFQARKNKYG